MTRHNKQKAHNDVNGSPVRRSGGPRPARRLGYSGPSTSEIPTEDQLSDVVTGGTWNVRTLLQAGKLELLQRELDRLRYDVVGLAEVRWPGSGQMAQGRFLYTGEQNGGEKGVAFFLSVRAKRALIEWLPISSRVIVARFKGRKNNLSVLQAYAPTADSNDEDLEEFYDQVEEGLTKMPNRDLCVVTGDWNAKIGNNNAGWEHVMGQFGIGERNERSERLLQFTQEKGLVYMQYEVSEQAIQEMDMDVTKWPK